MPNQNMRSTQTVEMVREEVQRGGQKIVVRANLPIGRGWQSGAGTIDWINMGWRSADEYDAATHKKMVEAEQLAAKKLADEQAVVEKAEAAKKAEDAAKKSK